MMRAFSIGALFSLAIFAGACGGSSSSSGSASGGGAGMGGASGGASGGGGSAGSGGGSGASCGTTDTSCPATMPYVGSLCDLADTCQYAGGDAGMAWEASCQGGRWKITSLCNAPPGGGCPVPPLTESCKDPFAGTAAGASVELGIADPTKPFRQFTPGEKVPIVWGGQGSPMLAFRVRVAGADPSCIRVEHTLTLGTAAAPPTPNAVAVHCGETLDVYAIVPADKVDCSKGGPWDLAVTIDVQGLGSASAQLTTDDLCLLGEQ